jgi:hypothetical protein
MVGRLRAYMAVVSAIGFVVLCALAANVDLDRLRANLPESALLTLVVLTAPFLGIPLSRDGRGPTVHVDAPFAFALALAAGPGSPPWWWPPPARSTTWPTTSRRAS